MAIDAQTLPGFVRFGPALPGGPVVFAVPHAGRIYPSALLAAAALPLPRLEQLEDRHCDLLIADAVAAGGTAIVAQRARCWIDLNRDPREIDPAMIAPPGSIGQTIATAKVRGGLGLIPRHMSNGGAIWREALAADDVMARIANDHAPYHAAVAGALATARASFGQAILLDCHSMPSIAQGRAARIILGDRHGCSAAPALMDRLSELAASAGYRVARNAPYAGGYTLDRHGDVAGGIHAIQIEIDRTLYLAPDLRTPGAGLPAIARLIARMGAAVADALIGPSREAAE